MATIDFRDYQRDAIFAAVNHMRGGGTGFYLNHDPGLGKTLEAIAIARLLKAKNIVVLTPVVGTGVWRSELKKWYPQSAGAIIRSNSGDSWGPVSAAPESIWQITNYSQIISSMASHFHRLKSIDLLIADESQLCKNWRTQTSRGVLKLAVKATNILLLSGTPAHSPLDWWAQYRLIDPQTEPWSWHFTRYRNWMARFGGPHQNWVKGYNATAREQVAEIMSRVTHVATSDQMHLPEPVETPIEFQLSINERRTYNQMFQTLRADLHNGKETTAPIVLTKLLRLHQITGGHSTDEDGETIQTGDSKLKTCLDLLEQREDQKVVVACKHLWEVRQIVAAMKTQKRAVDVIDGSVKAEKRADIQEWFQTTTKPAVLVLQYRSGGMALTLTAARAMILYSFEPSVIALQQMLGRCFRLGTTTSLQILPIMAKGTIDEELWYGLKAKADAVELAKLLRERMKI